MKREYQIKQYVKNPYLEFENHVQIPIKPNVDKKTLDRGYIGIWNENKNMNNSNNIVLAGHNIDSVFKSLHNIKIGEKINIYHERNHRVYEVREKKVISADDFSNFMETRDKRLTLITCINNKKKRLIVIATLV